MDNNGYKRSLKVTVTKYEGGTIAAGYPKTYDGMTSSSTWTGWSGADYTAINSTQLAQMSELSYETRLRDFQTWVESQETDLDFNEDVVAGAEAVIFDTSACTLPTDYYVLTVSANDDNLGSVLGGGTFYDNSSCTIRAIAVSGAKFDYWTITVGDEDPVTVTEAIYTFTLTDDTVCEATFSESVVISFDIVFTNHICQIE